MLYGAGVPSREMMKNAPQVGIATVWWEGNPCKCVSPHVPQRRVEGLIADMSRHAQHTS